MFVALRKKKASQKTEQNNPGSATRSQEGGLDLFLQLNTQLISKIFGSQIFCPLKALIKIMHP